jgi:hypothetical protein
LEGSMGRLGAPRAGLMSKASRGRAPSVKWNGKSVTKYENVCGC